MAIDINISTTFLGNTDTPNSYVGQANKVVSVKNDATGLEFTTISATDTNIYNTDGTLTANRTVTHNGFTLDFHGLTRVKAFNATSTSIGFSFRNFANTADLVRIYNTGNSEFLDGNHSFGAAIGGNTNIRLNAYTSTLETALRGFNDSNAGKGVFAVSNGLNGVGIQAQALNAGGGIGAVIKGKTYSLVFNGGFLDEAQSGSPTFPSTTIAGEVAFLPTIGVGRWYYLDNGDKTGSVKVKLSV